MKSQQWRETLCGHLPATIDIRPGTRMGSVSGLIQPSQHRAKLVYPSDVWVLGRQASSLPCANTKYSVHRFFDIMTTIVHVHRRINKPVRRPVQGGSRTPGRARQIEIHPTGRLVDRVPGSSLMRLDSAIPSDRGRYPLVVGVRLREIPRFSRLATQPGSQHQR